ncbi:MAG: RNase adapter RapZ [Syntrophomonadaceae bacterium]
MVTTKELKLLFITGMSGAGKTLAIRALEDLGYFCVDNLLPALVPKFVELSQRAEGRMDKIALVIDIRGGRFFDDLFVALQELKQQGYSYEILFLEASIEVLVNRYKETRRRHPLSSQGRLLEDILLEKERLEELRGIASKIIDTSDLSTNELKNQLIMLYGPRDDKDRLHITVLSFGYKYGVPLDADLVVDVRFLPNPYYVPELCHKTGCDQEVKDYVLESKVAQEFLQRYHSLLSFLLPHYLQEGKTSLVIAIGCTGGQHRSVTLANAIAEGLEKKEYHIYIRHRDLHRKGGGVDLV